MVQKRANVVSWALAYGLSAQGHGTLGCTLVIAAQEEEVIQGSVVNRVAPNLASVARFPLRDHQGPPTEAVELLGAALTEATAEVGADGGRVRKALDKLTGKHYTPEQL